MNTFFIISNSVIFRVGIKAMINSIEGFLVIAEGSYLNNLETYSKDNDAKFFIIDLDEYENQGINQMEKIGAFKGKAKIIGISKFLDEATVIAQHKCGIDALLHASCDIRTIKAAISEISAGKRYYTQTASEIIERHYSNLDHQFKTAEKIKRFNSKELEIIRLCCQQKTSKEIGKSIFLCEKTVDYHRQKIISKMDVRNMVGMVVYAIKNNMINLNDI